MDGGGGDGGGGVEIKKINIYKGPRFSSIYPSVRFKTHFLLVDL